MPLKDTHTPILGPGESADVTKPGSPGSPAGAPGAVRETQVWTDWLRAWGGEWEKKAGSLQED